MRATLVRLHLLAASFFSIILLMMAVSGGGYLLGFKGTTSTTPVDASGARLDFKSETLEADVRSVLEDLGISHDFDYLRVYSDRVLTRPTSKTYYEFAKEGRDLKVTRHEPDFQKSIVELHKGHGPSTFKVFQQVMAAGLIFVLLTGLWLGLSSPGLKTQTLIASGLGVLVFLALVFVA